MTVDAFEGPAGTGKTHSLMEQLAVELEAIAMAPHQRVLALTFMHGARRRLDARLRDVNGIDGRFQATTLDNLAWRLTQRWRRLAVSLGHALPEEGQYNETCALAADLMSHVVVNSWFAMSYPVVLVDEAQDLSVERSRMIETIAGSCRVLLAFDEFQCLNTDLLPISVGNWLPGACTPTSLTICRRTEDEELLEAARAVRNGEAVNQNGRRFKVQLTPSIPFAATYVANAIAWRNGGNVAILTPSRRGGFADDIVGRVRSSPLGQRQNGPFPVEWEASDENESNALWERLNFPDRCTITEAHNILAPHGNAPIIRTTKKWLTRQKNVLGNEEVIASDLRHQISRTFSARRRYAGRNTGEFTAMTIQQAKNREFDHVIVIWPYTIPNDAEQKRRLLYNAITRAKRSCLVLVQARDLLNAPPFVA